MAMTDSEFPIHQFVSEQLRQQIEETARILKTTKLKHIKEKIEEASYFQIRLVLAARRRG